MNANGKGTEEVPDDRSKSGADADVASTDFASADSASIAAEQPVDAISLLRCEHGLVKGLFAEWRTAQSEGDPRRATLIKNVCNMIARHDQAEERFFFPATREVMDDHRAIDQVQGLNERINALVDRLEALLTTDVESGDPVRELQAMFEQHVAIEEADVFPAVMGTGLDLARLGARMQHREQEIKADLSPATGSS